MIISDEAFLSTLGVKDQAAVNLSQPPLDIAKDVLTAVAPEAMDLVGSNAYTESINDHWSAHVVQHAEAIFHPKTAEEVSTSIKLFGHFKVPFAIRSGGHQTARGASAITNGVLLSLDRLNTISYDEKTEVVSFGPGNRWVNVYRHLHQYGRGITGGHIGIVGTGGHITGGGTSPFIHRHGFSSMNVRNFQVVLSNGDIVDANLEQNADLFWALKGGANNFGVVTRLDMITFPNEGVWGGSIALEIEKKEKALDWFWEFHQSYIKSDPGVEILLGFSIAQDHSSISGEVVADRRIPEGSCPKAFQPLWDLGLLYTNAHSTSLPDMAVSATENTSPEAALWFGDEGRMNFAMLNFKPNRVFYSEAVDLFFSSFEGARRVQGAQVNLHMSFLQEKTVKHANENGGMAAGWTEQDHLMFCTESAWPNAADDEVMLGMAKECIARIRAAAEKRNLSLPMIWMNNAQSDDDVLGSYGKKNFSKMLEVSAKYDPIETFQDLCAGAYKLKKKGLSA